MNQIAIRSVFRGIIFFSQKMATLAMNPKHASALTKESVVDEEWKEWRIAGGTLRFSSLCNISRWIPCILDTTG
jgi:hypothetical protein